MANMKILQGNDTISGKEARATMQTTDGRIVDLFFANKLEVTFEKKKTEIHPLGARGTHTKTTGWIGKGTMSLYYVCSIFRELAAEYNLAGIDSYFNLVVTNDDPASSAGKQTMVFIGCNTDNTILAKFDSTEGALEEEISFTFSDFVPLDSFNKI